ncbi:MAG TPA: MbnP family protein [Chitinophagaceae bacterium]|nr:MbnP family protein [Chitinophagaceae bacterium]
MRRYCLLLLTLALCSTACRKKDLPAPASPSVTEPPKDSTQPQDSSGLYGNVLIKWNHVAGSQTLVADGKTMYTAPDGNQYSVNSLAYYISNIVFIDEKGKRYKVSNSYRLITIQNGPSMQTGIDNIPAAKYTAIELLIGVDSLRNVSGVQLGALDPAHGMFWSWSTGYIMAKLEGSSPQSTALGKTISYHIAGFKGEYNVLQTIRIELPQQADIREKVSCTISLQTDVNTWFAAPNFPGFPTLPSIGSEGQDAFKVSQNYRKMITATQVENL